MKFWKKLSEKSYLKALIQENEELIKRNKELEQEIALFNDGDKRKVVDMKKEYETLIKGAKENSTKCKKLIKEVKEAEEKRRREHEQFMTFLKKDNREKLKLGEVFEYISTVWDELSENEKSKILKFITG